VIQWKWNERARKEAVKASIDFLNIAETSKVTCFLESFQNYEPTPLRSLPNLAEHLGVANIFIKDESYRFGLNAFKALGCSYAMGQVLAERLGVPLEDLGFDLLRSQLIKEELGDITFSAATDGNHGRAVAWVAQQLGKKSVIYMPKGSSPTRLDNIKAAGAEALITNMNYDDTVRLCREKSSEMGWIMIQDTAWEGYEKIPTWVMQGYTSMAAETQVQLKQDGIGKPTHIFVQAGVGSMAAATQGYFASIFQNDRPLMVVVEPDLADCMYRSALAGELRTVGGDMNTIMAGLACGEPNPIGWNILHDYADLFVSAPDHVSARGMRILGNPLRDDPRIISGESGAVGAGLLSIIMQNQSMKEVRELLKLDHDSIVLCFSTEGDTDPDRYRRIIWDGEFNHRRPMKPKRKIHCYPLVSSFFN